MLEKEFIINPCLTNNKNYTYKIDILNINYCEYSLNFSSKYKYTYHYIGKLNYSICYKYFIKLLNYYNPCNFEDNCNVLNAIKTLKPYIKSKFNVFIYKLYKLNYIYYIK